MDLRLDGKTAIVTGGSRGIGKAIAAAFVASGANVMITARKAETLQQTAAEIDGAGGAVAWFAAHAGEPEGADGCVRATLERFGALDILVNNAATNPYAGPLIDVDVPRFDKTVQVNLRGPLLWTQHAWRQWMKEHGGAVINISSVGGLATNSVLGLYNITKAALIHMTKQLAAELGPKHHSGYCATLRVPAWRSAVTFSGPLAPPAAAPSTFAVPNGGAQTFTLEVHDDLLNPLVSGSTIEVTSSVGKVTGGSIVVADGESFNQLVPGLTLFSFVVSDDNINESAPPVAASIVVKVTSWPAERSTRHRPAGRQLTVCVRRRRA